MADAPVAVPVADVAPTTWSDDGTDEVVGEYGLFPCDLDGDDDDDDDDDGGASAWRAAPGVIYSAARDDA